MTKKDWGSAYEKINGDLQKLGDLSAHWTVPENIQRLARAREGIPRIQAEQLRCMKLVDSRARDSMKLAGFSESHSVTPFDHAAKGELTDIIKSQETLIAQDNEELASASQSTIYTLFSSTLAAILVGSFVAIFLSRKPPRGPLTRPVVMVLRLIWEAAFQRHGAWDTSSGLKHPIFRKTAKLLWPGKS